MTFRVHNKHPIFYNVIALSSGCVSMVSKLTILICILLGEFIFSVSQLCSGARQFTSRCCYTLAA